MSRVEGIAVGGIAAIVVAVLVGVLGFGLGVVRLATGSMTPAYPADSLLLVRDVDARTVEPGDVVTVTRDGAVPITHRVVNSELRPGGVELVLRGDANSTVDPQPYRVPRVGLVLGGIPFGGSALAAVQSPLGLGAATVVVALLVLWAWWPRRRALHLARHG
jgi:signal peptidase